MPSNFPDRYAPAVKRWHWIIFSLVLLAYVFVNIFDLFPRGSGLRNNLLASHYVMGLLVLVLVFPRLWARFHHGRPPIAPQPPDWIERIGNITHVLLYLFLIVQPILGIITLQIGGKPVTLFGVTLLPSFVDTPDRKLGHQWEDIHRTLGTIFYYVIGLHILAALWHHYVRRDNTLKRML